MAAIPPALLGWLKLLHRKANLTDDWSKSGRPDSSWDNYSTTPFLSWHRFDLIDSSYALAVLADRTPAWRELYVELLDRMLARYITWWGALDWMTQEGDDPARADYPPEWKGTVVPAELFGRYNAPGWTGNGLEPWGFQPDPIGADGNLFYKGFLALILGLRRRISGEDTSKSPFVVIADYEGGWIYSHEAVLQTLERQWGSRPAGCHCENTKIWPYCLSAAGLGLHVSDSVCDRASVGLRPMVRARRAPLLRICRRRESAGHGLLLRPDCRNNATWQPGREPRLGPLPGATAPGDRRTGGRDGFGDGWLVR